MNRGNGNADGIGFNLLNTNIGAFDIDDCRNPASMEIDPFALDLVKRANSKAPGFSPAASPHVADWTTIQRNQDRS